MVRERAVESARRNQIRHLEVTSVELTDGERHAAKAAGRMIAATRLPSAAASQEMGFDSEMSSPRRRAIFFTTTMRDRSPMDTPGTC